MTNRERASIALGIGSGLRAWPMFAFAGTFALSVLVWRWTR